MVSLTEMLVFGGVVILVFGATQIPKLARSLGEGLKEFKKAVRESRDGEAKEGEAKDGEAKEAEAEAEERREDAGEKR